MGFSRSIASASRCDKARYVPRIAKRRASVHPVHMKFFPGLLLVWCLSLGLAHAQQDADARYISIYNQIQQADNLAEAGRSQDAVNAYTDALGRLERFQKIFPAWDPGIVAYRRQDLESKLTSLKNKIADAKAAAAAAAAAPSLASGNPAADPVPPQVARLNAQLENAQNENRLLQAKLKEALATQPAAVDASELAAAQKQLRELQKENELLKSAPVKTVVQTVPVEDTNRVSALQAQLAAAAKKLNEELARAEQIIAENTALQKNLTRNPNNAATLNLLQSENARLKAQLLALESAAANNAAADELAAQLKEARVQIANLQAAATLAALEKAALENKVRKLSAQLAESAANFESRLNDLNQQRKDLLAKLEAASAKNSRASVATTAAEIAALNREVATLRARVEVNEAKPVPYSAEELALFRQTSPPIDPAKRSVKELPAGSAELAASAQRHFARREFAQAEADYLKILERDANNGLALANLATIELQQGKLESAEKHIQAAVAQSPDDSYNLSTLGYLKFRQQKYDEALDALSRAAKLDPANPEIQNYLGVTLSHKGLRVPAETALRKALQLDSGFAPAHNNLAVIYLSQTPPLPQLARWHYQKGLSLGQPRNEELEALLAAKGAPYSPAP